LINQSASRTSTNPQPDVVLYKKGVENKHPTPEDIYLVIEVADATLNYDSDDKLRAYERGGIKEYWIIDVGKKTVNIYKFPSQEHNYARESHAYGVIAPQAFPDVTVDSQKSLSLDSSGRPIIAFMSPVPFTPEKECYTVLFL